MTAFDDLGEAVFWLSNRKPKIELPFPGDSAGQNQKTARLLTLLPAMSRKWIIICLGLYLITNSLMIRWIAYINHERSTAEEQLGEIKWAEGYRDAQEDFDAGQRRIYSMKGVPYPRNGQPVNNLTKEFIGRTNGSLEIWTWPYYQGDEVDLRVIQGQIGGYNMHMKCLCRYCGKPRLQAAANTNTNIGLTTAFPHTVLDAESK